MDLDLDLNGFVWICMDLDGFASPARSSVWCSPAGGFFFQKKTHPWCFCSLKQCFLHSTKTIFNGTRLDTRGLKS